MNSRSDETGTRQERRPFSWSKLALRGLTTGGPFAGLFVAVVLFAYLTREEGTFLTEFNLRTIAVQSVIVGLSALGMTLVIVSAGIDLSVGSQVALVTVLTAILGRDRGYSPAACVLGGVIIGTVCGFVNGLAIDRLRLMPFIVTLGTLQIFRGLAKLLAKNTAVYFPSDAKPPWLSEVMAIEPGPRLKGFAAQLPGPLAQPVLAIPPAVWLLSLMAVIVWIALRKTTWGRYVVAVGSNESTARLCGLRVGLLKVSVYTFCGFLTGLAGIMQFAEMNGTGDPVVAGGLELEVIAAVVIGGGSLAGGEASVIGTLVGALIMRVLRSGCVHAGIPNATQDILIGAIIVAAVSLDRFRSSLASRKNG